MRALQLVLAAVLGLLGCERSPQPVDGPPLPELPPVVERDAAPPPGPRREPVALTVVLSGEIRGEVEPCGCPTLPYGGFERREVLLERVRRRGPPVFQVDAGEALVKGLSGRRSQADLHRADLVLSLLAASGVDLMVPGPSDLLAGGWEALLRRADRAGIPLVSANWVDDSGRPLVSAWRVVQREGVRLGVIGLSGLPSPRADRDPVEAVREAAAALEDRADLVVVVTHAGSDVIRRVAGVPGIAMILATEGDGAALGDLPVPVVRVPPRGRYVAIVEALVGTAPGRPVVLEGPLAEAWERVVELRRRVARLEAPPDDLRRRLAEAEEALTDLAPGHNLAVVSLRPLGADLDGADTRAGRILESERERARADAAERARTEPEEGSAPYATAGSCASCHTVQYARWTFTDHKEAWFALQRRGEERNPECLPCHALGYGEPGGLGELTIFNTRRFGGVQCESCHGPMGGHPDDGRTPPRVQPATCLGCHDPANDPDFDPVADWGRVACPSDEEALPPG